MKPQPCRRGRRRFPAMAVALPCGARSVMTWRKLSARTTTRAVPEPLAAHHRRAAPQEARPRNHRAGPLVRLSFSLRAPGRLECCRSAQWGVA